MSKDFDWKTDEETGWVEEPVKGSSVSRPFRILAWFKRWGRWIGVSAVLLLIIGFVVLSLLNRQVEQVENTAIADVLAAHSLVRQAAQEKDFDLLGAMISTDSPTWRDLQIDLLNTGLFLERQPLYLKIDYDSQSDAPVVNMSPDLRTAELTERIPYQVASSAETIWLEQTFFYQRHEDSWLLSPLPVKDESFWGKSGTFEGSDFITLIYPRRDEDITLRLGSQLDDLIGRVCGQDNIDCPSDFDLELRFAQELLTLMRFNEDYRDILSAANRSTYRLFLPSPTLVGRPIDEAGRKALYHSYANWLAAAMVYTFSEEQLESQEIESTLTDWGLELPPEPSIALPIPQPRLAPPIAFPEQDILMACTDGSLFMMLRYNPRANHWSDELYGRETTYLSSQKLQFLLMLPLPDDSGILVSINQLDSLESNHNLISWRNGEEQLWVDSEVTLQLLQDSIQQQFDPSGQYIMVYDSRDTATSMEILPYAINLPSCLAGDCQIEDFHGFPYWSPDLSWTVVVEPVEQGNLTLRNSQSGEETSIGTGFSPFWVDNETFYYLRTEGDPNAGFENPLNVQIVSATVDSPLNGTPVLESADIAAAITGDDSTTAVSVQQVFGHSDKPDWFFIFAAINSSNGSRDNYLLGYQRDTSDLTILFEFNDSSLVYPLQVTPDGRYLSVPTADLFSRESSEQISINLVPLNPAEMTIGSPIETYKISREFTYDWSQDGAWLMISNPGELSLIAPGHNYVHTISHNFEQYCQAAWTNPTNSN